MGYPCRSFEHSVTPAVEGTEALGVEVAALSELRNITISMDGYTYWWCQGDGQHIQGAAIAISSRLWYLVSLVVEVSPVDKYLDSKTEA